LWLGRPNEWFNPSFMPNIASVVQARTLNDYVEAVQREGTSHGLFGVEVSAHELVSVFGSFAEFHRHFADATDFWLIRQDIVLQAVSLYKMVATGVGHRPAASSEAVRDADLRFTYDRRQIERWLRHIWVAEIQTETHFRDCSRTPIRLSYEDLTRHSATQVQNFFAQVLRTGDRFADEVRTGHDQIRTDRNHDFAVRFRAERRDLLAEVARERAGRLNLLVPLQQMLRTEDPMADKR
jgi:LPS sulfotransferase NodH